MAGAGLAVAGPASASFEDPVAQVEQLMHEAEYQSALKLIATQLSRQVIHSQRAQLYWLEGVCFISLEQPKMARSSFLKLLTLVPHATTPTMTSPKIRRIFDETKEAFKKTQRLAAQYQSTFEPIDNVPEGQRVDIAWQLVPLRDAVLPTDAKLHFRRVGDSDFGLLYMTQNVEKPTMFQLTFTPPSMPAADDAQQIEYYLEAVAKDGAVVKQIGEPSLPLTFSTLKSDYKQEPGVNAKKVRWWPWALAGGMVAVAGALLVVTLATQTQTGALHIYVSL